MTAPAPTRTTAQQAAASEALVRKARRARRTARRLVPLHAAVAVTSGTIALAGEAIGVDDGTRGGAAVLFVIAMIGFACAVRAVALPTAANTKENQ